MSATVARNPERAVATDPWTVATNAMDQLRRGGPDALRVLIARAMGGLGLPELASAWADSAPSTPDLAPMIAQIRGALPSLNGSEQSAGDRLRTIEANLTACPDLRDQLGPHLEAWSERQVRSRWFTARDGVCVVVDAGQPIDAPGALIRWGDERKRCRERALPPSVSDLSGPPAPVVLDGLRSAISLVDLTERFPRSDNRAWAMLLVVEPDPHAVLDALAERDLSGPLAEERLRIFAGPDAKERALAFLRDRRDDWATLTCLPDHPDGPDRAFQARLKELIVERAAEYRSLLARNNAAYADRDRDWWARRYARAAERRGEALRALVLTTRYSTYIQHASRDLCAAFEANGVQANLVIEPDDASRTDGLRIARAIDAARPDLFVVINYTRSQFADSVPRQMPHCCWVQDTMPHLFSRTTGADVDELSIVVGNVSRAMVRDHRYPVDACVMFDVPALNETFRAEPRETCPIDLLIATNHGESPEAMADRLDRECAASGGPRGMMLELHEVLRDALGSWRHGFLAYLIEDALGPVFERYGTDPGSESSQTIVRDAALPLVNRLLRHRVIAWADELARERGWSMTLAGRGWDAHPEFARHAVGEVPHGPALRDLYNRSLMTVHASSAWIFHQRIYESLLAGSLPAMLFKPDDLIGIMRPARVQTRLGLAPTCSRLDDRRLHVHALDHPVGAMALALAQRFSPDPMPPETPGRNQDSERTLGSGMYLWRDGVPDEERYIRELHGPLEQTRFIWSVADGFFRSKEELARVVESCRENPEWRLSRIRMARGIVERSFGLERAAAGMIDLMRQRLGGDSVSAPGET